MAKKKLPPLIDELLAEMERQGMTRYALAKKAGVPPPTVNRLLSGERDAQLTTITKLAEALGRRVILRD